jgi:hypothetical protein
MELGVTSNPDHEFICLPALCVKQIRKVITDMVPNIRLEEEEDAYGCNDDDGNGALLPLPPSFPPPDPPPPNFPPALHPLDGGGPGIQ